MLISPLCTWNVCVSVVEVKYGLYRLQCKSAKLCQDKFSTTGTLLSEAKVCSIVWLVEEMGHVYVH